MMLTLEKAKELQSKRQRTALLKFFLLCAVLVAGLVLLLLFTDYLEQYGVLYLVFISLAILAGKSAGLLKFFTPKEFTGTVVDCNLVMEPQRRYAATNQPGTNYASHDVPVLKITVENKEKKRTYKSVPYQWAWGEYRAGQEVALLRFIDQPILIKDI